MLNFTGSTRKRVVNLGNNRGENRGRSFLEQAKKDRQERELARQKEKCAILLQSAIRRWLSLRDVATTLYHESSRNVFDVGLDRWCAETSFMIRFGSQQLRDLIYPELIVVMEEARRTFSSEHVATLSQALNVGLARGNSGHLALRCLIKVFDLCPISEQSEANFKGMICNVRNHMTPDSIAEAIALVFKVNFADSPEAFIKFLIECPREYLDKSAEYSLIASNFIIGDEATVSLALISSQEIVSVIINMLILNPGPFTKNECLSHAVLLSHLKDIVVADTNDDLEKQPTAQEVVVSQKDFRILSTLLTSTYVRSVFQCFSQSNEELCVETLSQLLFVFPQSRVSICMVMSITPELPNWLYDIVSRNRLFADYVTMKTRQGPDSIRLVTDDVKNTFKDAIYTFNQVLSSWLVVSKDSESFQKDNFPLEKIKIYCQFLKSFCFCLIRDSRKFDIRRVKELKEISVSVLNQLYIKNLRINFFPQESWIVNGLELHSSDVTLDSKHEDYSSDEEESEDYSWGQFKSKTNSRLEPRENFELEILKKVPFFTDFLTRVEIFQNSIKVDKQNTGSGSQRYLFSPHMNSHKLSADIRRESILEDAFESFYKSGSNFKNDLKVTFHNEHGPEAGIDGGGLTKEFLTAVVKEGFGPKSELFLFKESSSYNLYPNDDIFWKTVHNIDLATQRKRLMYIRFLGMIIGKCLYEGILIDVSFVPSFLSKWRVAQNNSKNSVDDLVFLDPELYANLNKLLDMNEDQLRDLDLNFTIDEFLESKTYSFDLQPPSGAQQTVTTQNRLTYIHKVSHFKLNQSLQLQTKHFLEGLFQMIEPNWLNMFDPLELQMLISGGHDINLEDWKANVNYGGYFDDDETIQLFWEVVEEMTPQERCDLVKFVTSVSRAPLLGFGSMNPKFGISFGGSPDRLPTASTCMNLLKLPNYTDKNVIRQKLLYSIHANSGFDLS